MESAIPSNPSHGWRSILAGRDILKKGIGWIVGNDNHINLWNDPWLSPTTPSRPIGPPNKEATKLLVSDLINQRTGQWDVKKIRTELRHHEEDIRKIILPTSKVEDKLRWLPDKNGKYTTKSGYVVAKKNKSQLDEDEFNWNACVWRLKTSPKLKLFLWKALNQALSVGTILAMRGLQEVE